MTMLWQRPAEAAADIITGRPAASLVDAVKLYPGATANALDGVSVSFERGRFTAIMGPSGSGKSTMLHCLAGLDRLTSGHVWIGDTHVGTLDDRRLTRLRRDRIGFVFQSFNLLPTLTAAENIRLPLALARRKPDPVWFDRVIDVVGLRDHLGQLPSRLSGGQQQRIAAARALVSQPEIVLADEPTGNLDSRAAASLLAFLRSAVDELGQTIVMVTHDPVAASAADRVIFLVDGRMAGTVESPTRQQLVDRLHLLPG